MADTPFVEGVTAALVGVHDADIHLGFWRDELGYEVISTGVISAEVAKALYNVAGEIELWKLAPAQADSGQVWLMKTANSSHLEPKHPHTSEWGYHALDLYTRNALATHSQLFPKGWQWPALPQAYGVPFGDKVIEITEGFCFGPEGTDIVFVEATNERPTIAWGKNPKLPYTELTSVVCGVKDVELAKEFFGPNGLGMDIWYDVSFVQDGVNLIAELPQGSNVRLAFVSGSKTARIELIHVNDLPPRADTRAIGRPGKVLGHMGWSFVTHDLDGAMKRIVEKKGEVISPVVTTNDPLHGSARVVAAHTPEGAFIELWERI